MLMINILRPQDTIYLKALIEYAYIPIRWIPKMKSSELHYICILYEDINRCLLELACFQKSSLDEGEFDIIGAFERGRKIGAASIGIIQNHPDTYRPYPLDNDIKMTQKVALLSEEWFLKVDTSLIIGKSAVYSVFQNTFFSIQPSSKYIIMLERKFKECKEPSTLHCKTVKDEIEQVSLSKIDKSSKFITYSENSKVYKSILDDIAGKA